jgi:hypothetical protein
MSPFAFLLGYYLSQKIYVRSGVDFSVHVDSSGIWKDLLTVWTVLANVSWFTIRSGQVSRLYVNNTLNPWFYHVMKWDLPFIPSVPTPGEVKELVEFRTKSLDQKLADLISMDK